MAIKVTKRTTPEGARYSISGLTFSQLYRIKNAMHAEAEKMKGIADELADNPVMQKEFEGYRQDAICVFEAANSGLV